MGNPLTGRSLATLRGLLMMLHIEEPVDEVEDESDEDEGGLFGYS